MEAINATDRHFWAIVLSAHLNFWPKFSIVLLIAASFKKSWCSAAKLKTEYRTSFKQTNRKGPAGDYTTKRAWKVETRKVTTFSCVNIIINIAQKWEMWSNYCSSKKAQRNVLESIESVSTSAYSYRKCLEICCEHMEDWIKTRAYIWHNKGLHTDALNLQRQLKDISDSLDRLQAAAVTVTVLV